jgi:spermidine/putrescine transport system ATP-binding protein
MTPAPSTSTPGHTAEVDATGAISLRGLTKRFGEHTVLRGIDLDIAGGEFFSLLGPSGCGKTTTLRLIGGFDRADEGCVLLDGVDVSDAPPERRPVNTVFQSYALFPHLTVEQNVAFGLRFGTADRRSRDGDASARVRDALEMVQMTSFATRKPHRLSGGQQQRVALARALVLRPKVLLLDEPLGALDAKLRKALQLELSALQRDVGITFVYVTHDQEEALTMSDRLAVMTEGSVAQVGTPQQVYDQPASAYVAAFLGVANLFAADHRGGGRLAVGDPVAGHEWHTAAADAPVGRCHVVVRPERIRLATSPPDAGTNQVRARVDKLVYVGPTTHVHLDAAGMHLQALVANDGRTPTPTVGDDVTATFAPDAVHLVPE